MSSEIRRGDEKFVLGGTTYEFMFPQHGGPLGASSSSPFAPKTVTGDRQYSDYDMVSNAAFSDFSGGMGQDRAVDLTKYYSGVNIDTRGGRLVLGPEQRVTAEGDAPHPHDPTDKILIRDSGFTETNWLAMASGDGTVASFIAPSGCTSIRRLWLPLRHIGQVGAVQLVLKTAYDGGTVSEPTLTLAGKGYWQEVLLGTPWTVTPGVTYWVQIASWVGSGILYWYGANVSAGNSNAYHIVTAAYVRHTVPRAQVIWAEGITDVYGIDAPVKFLIGAGADTITRLWAYGGRQLYYLDYSGAAFTRVMDGGGTPAVKDMGYEITDAVWWKDSAASTHSLFVALGAGAVMVEFDGTIGTEVFADVAGIYATKLCVQDTILWRSYSGNQVDGGEDGAAWGTAVDVGSTVYPVKAMCIWQGKLYVGKEDGIWAVSYPSGYPGSGTPTVEQILDFTNQIHENNFDFMVTHQDDLYFSLAGGIMRFTTGGVLTPVTPAVGSDKRQSQSGMSDVRNKYRAAFSSLNVLWVTVEGPMEMQSGVMAYVDGAWTPIIVYPRYGDMARSVIIEPGLYSDAPRLWYTRGLQPTWSYMPTTTLRRWERDRESEWMTSSWAESGYLETSWFDGNILAVDKNWMDLTLYVLNTGPSPEPGYLVYWRPNEETGWARLDAYKAIDDGAVILSFPVGSYSKKMALRVYLTRGYFTSSDYVDTPVVQAIVVRYIERPRDSKAFTTTYELADAGVWRSGEQRNLSLAQQFADLRTLREAKEPLTWTAWWGTSYKVHIVEYNVSPVRDGPGTMRDIGRMLATIKLQEMDAAAATPAP
jgi:hypothetical protein